MSEEKLHK